MKIIAIAILVTFLTSGFLHIITIAIAGPTLGKHFDKLFYKKHKKPPMTFKLILSRRAMRGGLYAWMLFWNGNPADRLYVKYPNFFKHVTQQDPIQPSPWSVIECRPNARKIDWFIASLIWISCFVSWLSLVAVFIVHPFLHVHH